MQSSVQERRFVFLHEGLTDLVGKSYRLSMSWLNHHHLLYFRALAREGSLEKAAKSLHVSHPTISVQVHALEDALGHALVEKQGRRLVLTEQGRTVARYADEIFTLGREMQDVLARRDVGKPLKLAVGVVDAMPKMIVRRLLEPALALPVHLVCHQARFEELLHKLATQELDIVLADAPVPPGSAIRAYQHVLGESGVGLFGVRALVEKRRANFPSSLDGAPLLLPMEGTPLRRAVQQWCARHNVTPTIVAEADDGALLKAFGGDGLGLFPAPLVVEDRVRKQYGVVKLADLDDVRERFYAISIERRLKHPAVLALTAAARDDLFATHKNTQKTTTSRTAKARRTTSRAGGTSTR